MVGGGPTGTAAVCSQPRPASRTSGRECRDAAQQAIPLGVDKVGGRLVIEGKRSEVAGAVE